MFNRKLLKIIPFTLSRIAGKEYHTDKGKDKQIVTGIIDHDESALRSVYREYFDKIRKMVYTFDHARLYNEDIFKEGMMAMGEDATGDFIRYNKHKYLICDPTYINAPVGYLPEEYDAIQPEVINFE